MSKQPYRPDPQGSEAEAEFARLAAKGQRRIRKAAAASTPRATSAAQTAAQAREKKRDRNVRLALGAYHGTPLRKACFALMGVGPLTILGGALLGRGPAGVGAWVGGFIVGMLALTVGGVLAFSIDRTATRATVAAERAWAASLPFAMDDYFDLLAQDPVIACRLLVEVSWEPGRTPAPEIVRGALGLWDAGVGVKPGGAGTMTACGSTFKCGYRSSRTSDISYGPPVPNRHLVGRVHRLVDKVLLPLHRSHALARVSLRREVVSQD